MDTHRLEALATPIVIPKSNAAAVSHYGPGRSSQASLSLLKANQKGVRHPAATRREGGLGKPLGEPERVSNSPPGKGQQTEEKKQNKTEVFVSRVRVLRHLVVTNNRHVQKLCLSEAFGCDRSSAIWLKGLPHHTFSGHAEKSSPRSGRWNSIQAKAFCHLCLSNALWT